MAKINLKPLLVKAEEKSPAILVAVGIGGLITTVVMACKATPKYMRLREDYDGVLDTIPDEDYPTKTQIIFEEAKIVGKCYWPSIVSGALSVACFVSGHKINIKRNATLAAAYQLAETGLKEYQSKVTETIGERKEKEIRNKVAQKKVDLNPPEDNNLIDTGTGSTLCFDAVSGRYFKSDIEKIRQVENLINKRLITENSLCLNDFYDELNLPYIKLGECLGWDMRSMDDLLKVDYSSNLTRTGQPCLVISYSVFPIYGYFENQQ